MPRECARADAREPFSGAAARCLYPLTLTRFLRAEILAHWAGGRLAETLAAQGHCSRVAGLERSYGRDLATAFTDIGKVNQELRQHLVLTIDPRSKEVSYDPDADDGPHQHRQP